MKYRKKPIIIEAIQWTGDNFKEISTFVGDSLFIRHQVGGLPRMVLCIKTLEGDHDCSVGDYIIRGIKGEYYPCKPNIFEETYERMGWY